MGKQRKTPAENQKLWRDYLEGAKDLPYDKGEPNLSKAAEEAGVTRGAIYDKDKGGPNEALWEKYKAILPARPESGRKVRSSNEEKLERENRNLEAKNAALKGEIYDLRRRLNKAKEVEGLIENGKRPIP